MITKLITLSEDSSGVVTATYSEYNSLGKRTEHESAKLELPIGSSKRSSYEFSTKEIAEIQQDESGMSV